MVVVGQTVYFNADDGVHGRELWRSDGTASGTEMVADIAPGSASSDPSNLTNVDGVLYFTADDGTHGHEPWTSDGTGPGTTLLRDVRPGTASSVRVDGGTPPTPWNPRPARAEFVSLDGAVYFAANDGVHGPELWRSDGTEAGTVLFKDIRPGTTGSAGSWVQDFEASTIAPHHLTRVGDKLVFAANDGTVGKELWASDGTADGTQLLKDLQPGSEGSLALTGGWAGIGPLFLPEFVEIDGTVFFTVNLGGAYVGDTELWRTDGTDAGTTKLAGGFANLWQLTNSNQTLFFNSGEPWTSNGTVAGTQLVGDIHGAGSSSPSNFTYAGGGRTVFVASTQLFGRELWQTQGAGVVMMIADLAPGTASTFEGRSPFAFADDRLLFAAKDSASRGEELWSIPRFTTPPPPPATDDPPPSQDTITTTPDSPPLVEPPALLSKPSQPQKKATAGIVVAARQGVIRGRTLRLDLGCTGAGPCANARLTVRAPANRRRGSVLLARGPVKIAANRKTKVSLRLTARGRKLLAANRRLKATTSGPGIAPSTIKLRILR